MQKIALNADRCPNMGRVSTASIEAYDKLIAQPWLAGMINEIRAGKDELKQVLPFRLAHYSHCHEDRRPQKTLDAESFLFLTTIDIDDLNSVAYAISKAKALDKEESVWKGMLRHIEYSARGKAHIDIKMPVGMTIAEAQKSYCEALGVPYDESCVSPERIIFITDKRQEVYRHADWYAMPDEAELAERRKAFADRGLTIDGREQKTTVAFQRPVVETSVLTETTVANCEPLPQSVAAFDLCVKQAGLDPTAMDVWGEHNWHNNLLAVLSVGVAKLMTREQLMAVIRMRMGNYAPYADCQSLVDYFYNSYAADKTMMSARLRDINAQSQLAGNVREVTLTGNDDDDLEQLTDGYNPPSAPKKLPRVCEMMTRDFTPELRDMVLLTMMPNMAAVASHYRARYINGEEIGPQDYVVVIGGSGKGKSQATAVHDIITEKTLGENDRMEVEKLRVNTEEREKMANAKDKPAKYHPKLRQFETASSSSILELMTNLGPNSMLLGHFTEADAFCVGGGSSSVLINALLRKGWSGEVHTQYYLSESSCNTIVRMCMSMVVCGTVQSVLGGMLGGKNAENGMMQRFIPVVLRQKKRTFVPPKNRLLSHAEMEDLQSEIVRLYTKDLALGDSTQMLDLPEESKAVEAFYINLEERFTNGEITDAEVDLASRIGEHMMRAAIPLVALYGEETKEIVEYAKWVGEYAYYNICWLFGHRVAENLRNAQMLMGGFRDTRKTAEPILDRLPRFFTLKQVKEARLKAGQSDASTRTLLSRYVKAGKLKRVSNGVYEKVSA